MSYEARKTLTLIRRGSRCVDRNSASGERLLARTGSGVGPWRYSYVYDPQYRRGPPTMRAYIRDLYLYGPAYANWKQQRRWGWR